MGEIFVLKKTWHEHYHFKSIKIYEKK
jgi:hypothetical protein